MSFKFGKSSMEHYHTLTPNLQRIVFMSLKLGIIDFSITCGHRDKEKQDEYYYGNPQRSKVHWPNSKHNSFPSKAVDIVPYINGKISWNKLHCCILAGIVLSVAKNLGIKIRWGGNWDMDYEPITDQNFQDLVHFEEVE